MTEYITLRRLTDLEIEPFRHIISRKYGMIFRSERNNDIREAIRKRMTVHHMENSPDYLRLIQFREEEFLLLIGLLTINETYFFRESTHLDVISKYLAEQLRGNQRSKPVFRLLSAGCSTGEEVYSLAMTLLEIPGAGLEWDFRVFGVDVDISAIEKARAGVFGPYSFRVCPEEFRMRYFESTTNGKVRISSAVREKVEFAEVNLCAPVYPAVMEKMDIIFYRNVSIYFSKEWQQELFRRLAGLLDDGGLLFVSSTELLNYNASLLTLVNNNSVFYYKKHSTMQADDQHKNPPPSITSAKPIVTPRTPWQNPTFKAADPMSQRPKGEKSMEVLGTSETKELINRGMGSSRNFDEALEMAWAKQYEDALMLLEELISADPSFVKAYNLQASILLNQQKTVSAMDICLKVLSLDSFCLEAYLLLGMAARIEGQTQEALRRFKEAVYLQPDCWLAHFYMGDIFHLRQEMALAQREYEITEKILRQGDIEKHGLTFFPIAFQADHFIQLCQHYLKKMDETTKHV